MPLVTILAQEMRFKFFFAEAVDMLGVPLSSRYWREKCDSKFFN